MNEFSKPFALEWVTAVRLYSEPRRRPH